MPAARSARFRVPLVLLGALFMLLAVTVPALAKGRNVHVTKIDGKGNPIKGARFELFVDAAPKDGGPPKGAEDTKSAGSCTTDASGQCDIDGVPAGDYWLSEVGPPNGFTPAPDSQVEVKRKGPAPSIVVSNDKTPKSIRVNNPSGDASVGDGTHIFQFGPTVALDPSGKHVVVAFGDTAGAAAPPVSFTGFAFSSNGGGSFTDGGEMPVSPSGAVDFGQPSVTYDPVTNRFYVATFFCAPNFTQCPIVVRSSTDNGATWTDPVNAIPSLPSGPDAHTPDLLVDPFSASPFFGNLYLGWTESNGTTSQVFVSRSTDGGQTWGSPAPVSSSGRFDYPSLDVAPNGNLYVAWSSFQSGGVDQNQFFVSSSTDGGATFTPPAQIGGTYPASGHATTCNGQAARVLNGNIFSQDPPNLIVDPLDLQTIFVSFGSHGAGNDEADVFVARSSDGGATWTTPTPILPTAKDQFFPTMAVTPKGRVGVFFFNRAFDAPRIDLTGTFFDAGTGKQIGATRVTPRGFGAPMLDPNYDSLLNDCFGFDLPEAVRTPGANGFSVVWNDARDRGPAADNGVDPNISFSKVPVPRRSR